MFSEIDYVFPIYIGYKENEFFSSYLEKLKTGVNIIFVSILHPALPVHS